MDKGESRENRYVLGYNEEVMDMHSWRSAESCAAHLLPHLETGFRLLDFGCGNGSISMGLAEAVAPGEFHGIDREESVIERARSTAAARGHTNANLEAVVQVPMRSPAGQVREVDAVIDTGFNGFLTLPPALAAELEFPYVFSSKAILADGSEARFDVVGATVLWDDEARYVETGAVGVDALVGMSMIEGHDLHVRVEDGGRVAIQPAERGIASC